MWHLAEVSLRPEMEEDALFLEDLVLAIRDSEIGYRDFAPGLRTELLRQQGQWQAAHYRTAFPNAYFLIIEVAGKRAGRLYLAHLPEEIRVIDLSIDPTYQSHGIGTELLKRVQAEATRSAMPVRLAVIQDSAARIFYERLGFYKTGEIDGRLSMEWKAIEVSSR